MLPGSKLPAWLSELAERHRVGRRLAAGRIAQGRELLDRQEAQATTPDDRARLSELRSALDAAPSISPHENPAAGLSARQKRNRHEPQGGEREFGARYLLRGDLARFVHWLGERGASRGLRLARLSITVPAHLGGDVLTVRTFGELFAERVSHGGMFDGAMLVLDHGKRGGAWHLYGLAVTCMSDDELRSAWLRISGAGNESQLIGEILGSAGHWSPTNHKLTANLLRVIDYATKRLPADAEPYPLHERIIAAGSLAWTSAMPDCGPVAMTRVVALPAPAVAPARLREPVHRAAAPAAVTAASAHRERQAVTDRERIKSMPTETKLCESCNASLPNGARADARFCSVRCRVRAHRAGSERSVSAREQPTRHMPDIGDASITLELTIEQVSRFALVMGLAESTRVDAAAGMLVTTLGEVAIDYRSGVVVLGPATTRAIEAARCDLLGTLSGVAA